MMTAVPIFRSDLASPLKREMLRGALAGKVSRKDFPAWYQDILGKPYTELLESDVKPLIDAAWWIGRAEA